MFFYILINILIHCYIIFGGKFAYEIMLNFQLCMFAGGSQAMVQVSIGFQVA